jgi:succinate-semialdehyde dehydrogenase/glutarate-semialdehyde dehydrogenase
MSATTERTAVEAVPTQLFIGGEWRDASGGATLDVEDPSTGETIAAVADATPEDAKAALDACCAVQGEWAEHPPRERGEILRRAFELITERADDLAMVMTLEMGKPLAESKSEVTYASEFFRWFAEEAVRIEGRFATAPNGAGRLITMRQPVGPCYAITPWNFPMAMGTRKIGRRSRPAARWSSSPRSRRRCRCTRWRRSSRRRAPGGRAERRHLAQSRATSPSRSSATRGCASSRSRAPPRSAGCSSSSPPRACCGRRWSSAATRRSSSSRTPTSTPRQGRDDRQDAQHRRGVHGGQPLPRARLGARRVHGEARGEDGRDEDRPRVDEGVEVGPLIDATQRDKVAELVEDATGKGADVVVGGSRGDGAGYFYEPTVLGGVSEDARLLKEEIFGPVAPVIGFSDEEQAVAAPTTRVRARRSYVYTSTTSSARSAVCEGLETGMIGLKQGLVSNPAAPFGGVKASGSAARAAPRGSTSTSRSSTSAMAMD